MYLFIISLPLQSTIDLNCMSLINVLKIELCNRKTDNRKFSMGCIDDTESL